MKKKFVFLLIFILIILIYNNSYAFDNTNFNAEFLNNLDNYTIEEFIPIFNNYFSPNLRQYSYFVMIKGNGINYIYTSSTPFGVKYTTRYYLTNYFDSTNFFQTNNSYSYFDKFTFQSSPSYTSSPITSNTNIQNMNNLQIIYSNYDIINIDDNSTYFTKNFDLIQEDGDGSSIDMTETNILLTENFDIIKAFLFLICLYLLCKTIYGVIWWLYNKVLL